MYKFLLFLCMSVSVGCSSTWNNPPAKEVILIVGHVDAVGHDIEDYARLERTAEKYLISKGVMVKSWNVLRHKTNMSFMEANQYFENTSVKIRIFIGTLESAAFVPNTKEELSILRKKPITLTDSTIIQSLKKLEEKGAF